MNNETIRAKLKEALVDVLGDAMDCTRAWTAWGYGTMSQDDFIEIREDDERMDEIVEAVMGFFKEHKQ